MKFLVFLLLIAVGGGAFYGGMRYQTMRGATEPAKTSPTPAPTNSSALEQRRATVDAGPQKWITDTVPLQLTKEGIGKAMDSKDPEFLYLYGRAQMLTGDDKLAMQAFDQALTNFKSESKGKMPLDVELRLANASAALKLKEKSTDPKSQEATMAEQKAMHTLDELLNLKNEGGAK